MQLRSNLKSSSVLLYVLSFESCTGSVTVCRNWQYENDELHIV